MQEPLTSPVSQLISGLPASGTGKSSVTPEKGEGAFLKMLSMLSHGAAGRNTVSLTGEGNQTSGLAINLADLLPTLLTSDINDLGRSLQTIASMETGGTEKASLPVANSSILSGDGGSTQKTGQSVETFLSALMTLFGSGGIKANGEADVSDNTTSGSGVALAAAEALTSLCNPGSASGLVGETTKGADEAKIPSARPVNHEESTGDTRNALQVLALLVFNSLAAVLQVQPQEASSAQGSAGTADGLSPGGSQTDAVSGAPGQETIYRALVDLERLCNGALPAPQSVQGKEQGQQAAGEPVDNKASSTPSQERDTLPTDLLRAANQSPQAMTVPKAVPRGEGDERLPMETSEKGKGSIETPPEGKGAPPAEIKLAVVPSAADGAADRDDRVADRNTVVVTIKTPIGAIAQNVPTQMTGETGEGKGTINKGFTKEEGDPGITTMVKDLSPLLKGDDEGSAHHNGGDKGRPSEQDGYPFAAKFDAAGTGGVGQEQVGKTSGQPIATAAVERFEKIIERLGGGTGQHNLTVKLDMGKEGSVVLGLKNLGPSVTVEVRASDQGIINLLQSQKESIIKNLEGKDVHANIFIDPNASETPDKRDRRETGKQRAFQPAPGVDAGFGEFLEVFA